MKKVIAILFQLSSIICFAQTSLYNFSVEKQTISLDSFTFCTMHFKVPRDCNKKFQGNCCSFRDHPNSLNCNNGVSLSWLYEPNEALAKMNSENMANQIQEQMKKAKTDTIICFLADKETKAYRLKCKTKDGNKFYEIFTYAVINGQAVVVYLMSDKKINKNKNLQPVMREILSFKE